MIKIWFNSGSILTLNNTHKYHAGFIQCFACNILGCSYWAAMIQVNPKQITQLTSQQHYYEGDFNKSNINRMLCYFILFA